MMFNRLFNILILLFNVNFQLVLTTKNVNKCPTIGCVARETLPTTKVNNYFISDDPSQYQTSSSEDKPNILTRINEASSKKITESSTTKLSSSFSQGYIDLGSRDPREEGAATLAFVFDTTGSMYDDLRQVIDGAGKILKTVLEKFERPINDYVLVPFNDPDIGKMTVTSDPEEFKESLHELQYYIQGGGDCPEMAVGAIKMALEVCLPSSYIYVFTDARAKDYYLLDDVLRLIQKKHTQVVFVMTGDCGNKTHPGYQAFETIASTSSGQVFHLNKSDVDEVLNFVRLSLESRKVNLLSVDRKSNEPGEESLQLLVDKTLREFTISVSGQKPKIEIFRPELEGSYKKEEKVDELLNLENVKIVGVKRPTPGRYNISVGSESQYTVRATGLSSIDFQAGFSLKPTTNFKETYHRPMKGGVSNVLVKPLDETEFGDLFRLQLISLDGKVLEDIPLERLPGHETLFRGTSAEAPDEPFNIKVFGRDKEGFEFERISPTAVSSQLPFPPEVIAKEREEGYYDHSVVITCHIQTLVPFNVTWKKSGKYIAGPYRYPQSAEVSHVIERPTSRDEGIYTCLASNIAGNSFANIFLDIKEPPPDVYVFGNASLTPGLSGILRCDVTSTVEFNVTWSRYKIRGQVLDFFGRLETVGEFVLVEEVGRKFKTLPNNSLLIENVSQEDNGWYRCSASNEGGTKSKEMYLEVHSLPEVSVSPVSGTFRAAENLTLTCIGRGVPAPSLHWLKDGLHLTGAEPRVKILEDSTVIIFDTKLEDEGTYTCVAENPAGRGEANSSLVFVEAAKVFAVEEEVLSESGSTATLQCYAEGIPPPTIRWFKEDSSEVLPLSFIDIKDGYLRISGVQASDGGTYTCVASNGVGTAEDQVTLSIGSAPSILQAPTDNTIEVGATGGLSCYGIGIPQPTIRWHREGGDPLPPHFLQDKSGALRVNGMRIEDEGTYVCVLENRYGRKEIKSRLSVSGLLPPLIAAPPNPHIRTVASDSVTLPCTVVMATPSPTISWYFEEKPIELKEGMFVTREGDLRIPFAKPYHEGRYRCEASNVAGNSSLDLYLNVLEPPRLREGRQQEEVRPLEGDRVRLRCPVGGDPTPTYSWQKNGELVQPFQRRIRIGSDGTMLIREVKDTDNGVYVCTAINAAGATNTAVTLTVLVPPEIAKDPETYTIAEGEVIDLPCRSSGSPSPSITWRRRTSNLPTFLNTTSPSGSLRIDGTPENEGIYECTAINEAGNSQRIVKLIVNKVPEIFPSGGLSLSVVAGEDLKLPCEVEGHPTPKVSWTKDQEDIQYSEFIQRFDGYLLLKNVSPDLKGKYTCQAENRAGADFKTVDLVVHYPPKIIGNPDETQLKKSLVEGSRVTLPCPGTGDPTPVRSWTKNGNPLHPGRGVFIDSSGTVDIEKANRGHTGIYECILANNYGYTNWTYNVSVMVPPMVPQDNERPQVIEGKDITIRCPVDAIPIPSIKWLKDGVTIFSTKDRADVTHIIVEDNGQTLHIFEATMDDQGTYRCIVRNSAGESSKDFPLRVLVPPQFENFLHDPNIIGMEGEEVVLDCSVDGDPKPEVEWEKNGFSLPSLFPQVSANGREIRITKVTQSDTGVYVCTATNIAGSAYRTFNLTVYSFPTIESFPGRSEEEVVAIKGQDTRIVCRVSGNPDPVISWYFEDTPLQQISDILYTLQDGGQLLTLHALTTAQSGTYICNATNAVGTSLKNFNVSVFTSPSLIGSEEHVTQVDDLKILAEKSLELTCEGEGNPPPSYSWFWENRPLVPSLMSYRVNKHELVIDKIKVENSGTFTCLAVNPAGTAEKHFNVSVQVPAHIGRQEGWKATRVNQETVVNSTFTLFCPASGVPEPSILWSKDDNLDFLSKHNLPLGNVLHQPNIHHPESQEISRNSLKVEKNSLERSRISSNGRRLTVDNATHLDSGVYACVAENEAGKDKLEFLVSVLAPPKIIRHSETPILVPEGTPLTLECDYQGTPKPLATWLINGADLKTIPLDGVKVNDSKDAQTSLIISRIGREHIGTYTCLVSSVAGSDEVSIEVSVASPPETSTGPNDKGPRIIISRVNRPVSLHCQVDAFPPPQFEWYKEDTPLQEEEREYSFNHDGSVLSLMKTTAEDAGTYSCIAVNSAGSASVDFNLEVHVPPHLEEVVEEEVTVEEGKSVRLSCPVKATPPPSILWMKASTILPSSFTSREPHYLTIINATREDRGRFTCLATNEAGTFEQSYTVNVLVPPKLEDENKAFLEETVLVNRQATVSCFIVAESLLDIEWWKDGQPLGSLKPGMSLDSTKKRLTFSQVEIGDAGNYTCVASNQAGQINITTSLQVLVPPFWKKVSNQDEIFGKNGVSLDLECDAGGFPAPSLLWIKDGQILEAESANIALKDYGRVLRILSPSDKDSGQYSCVATNPAGTLEKNVKVSIRVPPSLLYNPISKIKVLENRAVTFDCPVEGKPTPEITWLIDRETIDENSPFIRFSNQRKHLHYLRITGSGNIIFSCVAKNPVGELITDFFTEVLRPPVIEPFPLESPINSVEGDALNLKCNVEGYPSPKVVWVTKKGTLLTQEETYLRSINISDDGLSLAFSPLQRFHQGVYLCLASNEGGRSQASFNVIVNRVPSIETPISGTNISITQSFPTMLSCNVDSKPEAEVTWFKEGEDVTVSPDPFLYLTHSNQNLRFLHTLESHEGVYKCVATNDFGIDELEFQLNVLTLPTIVETPSSHIEVKIGDSFSLECKVEGKPIPKISWRKGDFALRLTEGMELLDKNQRLKVAKANVKDAGNYLCVATSDSGTSQMDFEVRVYDPPQIIDNDPKEQKAVVGREQIFRCESKGVPPPIITWTRRGSTLHRLVDPNIQISTSGTELRLPRVRESDGGQYSCVASSLSGQDSKEYFLVVHVPPTISRANQPKIITGVLGKWVELICEAFGNPRPNITWYQGGVLLPVDSSERYKVWPRGDRLRIEKLEERDGGSFTCEAENEAGIDSRNLTLTILVPPKVIENATTKLRVREGSNVVISCPIHGRPTPTITWSLNSFPLIGQSKGNFEVRKNGKILSIVRVSRNDAATYVCTAWNPAGSVQHPIELEVLVPPLIVGVSETGQEEETFKVIEGGHVTFECQLHQGHPQPSRTWFKGPDLIPINLTVVGGGERLVISKTTVEDAETYECVAENEVGFSVKHFLLEVQTPPEVNVTHLREEGLQVEDTLLDGGSPLELPPDGRPRRTEVKTSISTTEGSTITIPCPITGNPHPHILWQKGTRSLLPSPRVVVSPSKSSLTLTNVLTKEGGMFSCIGVNPAGEATLIITVDVEGPPIIEGELLEKVTVVSGETLEMECKVTLAPPKSSARGPPRHKPLNVTWTKNGIPLSVPQSDFNTAFNKDFANSSISSNSSVNDNESKLSGKYAATNSVSQNESLQFILSRDNFKLSVLRVKEGQDGHFACIVENRAGRVMKTFNVHVLEPPTIETEEESQEFEAAVGEPVVFECNASGEPPPVVSWNKGLTPILPGSRHQLLEASHVLIITSVQESDAGEYTCLASNTVGVSVENFILSVLVPPVLKGPAKERAEVVSGRPVTLECAASGIPQPTNLWRFEEEILFEGENIKFVNGSLLIERVSPDLAGEYICDVENSVGRTFKATHLIVKEAPLISGSEETEVETVIKGQAASLHCSASGHPIPTLHWEKDGHGIRLDSRVSVSWGGRTLLIQDISPNDAGRYACTASNSAGNDTKHYRLNVLEPPTIEEGPHEVVAVEGEVVTVFCSVSGNPPPKITWHEDRSQITEKMEETEEVILNSSSNENILNDFGPIGKPTRGLLASGALQFSPILVTHAGNYSCVADNEAGSVKHEFPVSVLLPPEVTLELSSHVTTVGGSVDFFCKVEGSSPITYSWKKERTPIHPGQEFQIMSNGTLVLHHVTLDMAGSYTCSAKNPAGVSEDSQVLTVNELPKVSVAAKEIIVAAGDNAELECFAEGQPKPSIGWSRPDLAGLEITPKDSRIQIIDNRLKISPVISEDMGTYQCTGTNRAGSESANLALVVTSVPEIKEELDEELTLLLGETITLSCTPISGYPPPEIIWRKEGRLLRGSSRVHLATNGEIVIDNAKAEDSGMYSCLVVNAAGRLYRVVNVVVQVPPRLTLLPRTQQVTRGDSLTLTCEAVGVPTPSISWLLNGTEVDGAPASEGGRGKLVIERAAKSDEGTYTCVATNSAGYRKAVAGVRVKVPPVILSSPVEMTVQELSSVMLTCLAEGDPLPATTWTKEGHYIASSDRVRLMKNGSLIIDSSKGSDTGIYKCVASNDAGAAEAVSLLRVTTPPKIIEGPSSKEVEVGQTVVFDCIAEGEPKPELQWTVAFGELHDRYKTLTNGSLQLVAVQVEDEGQVICQVFNELGEDLAKANITVRVAGGWSSWTPWSVCSTVCGPGQQIRQRFCNNPAPRNGGKECVGEGLTTRPCEDTPCPINGGWSLWEDWSKCSVTCGSGVHLRKRLCNHPVPLHGGLPCEGPDQEEKPCKMRECPVDGSWSEWSEWTSCSRTCGDALKQRTRLCNAPPPHAGGKDCVGEGLEVMPCGGNPCTIDGGWSEWSEWSDCSVTCGEGIQYRRRGCDNPAPVNGGKDCEGEHTQEKMCKHRVCVVHGEWSFWSPWSQCSVTCGIGHRQRVRLCNNPPPEGGGQICRGPRRDSRPCKASPCPIHGNWGSWSEWSSCSKTCGPGQRQRSRLCNNPYPRNGGDYCKDSNIETMTCEDFSCSDLPLRAYGTLRGWLNGQDLGVISMSGNVTANGNQKTLVVSLSPLLPQFATWLTPLVSVVSSAIFSSAYESNGAVNGYSLTKGSFTRDTVVTFGSGEKVVISQTARGVDESGTLRFNVEVNGDVPYLQPGSFVTVQPFLEEYIQTDKSSLYVSSKRTFAVNGYHHPYSWVETVDYDRSLGMMPFLRETLHANSVSASYRCLSGVEGSNAKGELSLMVSSVIMPSSDNSTCPDGFTYSDQEGQMPLCLDNDECQLEGSKCSHYCKNVVGSFECQCPDGYEISSDATNCQDIDECLNTPYPCGPREECQNTPGSFVCEYSCRPGFKRTSSGTGCEDVDECEEEEPACEQRCQNLIGSYRCECFRGFNIDATLGHCIDVDECELYRNPCSHKCINVPGSFECRCPDGYYLLNNGRCKDVDECSTFQHNCTDDQDCRNFDGGFSCLVNCPAGLRLMANGSCIDIDECAELTAGCHYTQRCENMWGRYRCSCQKGFKSMGPGHPCLDINECHTSPPPCNYECRNLIGDYECICPPGFRRLRDRKTCIASYQYAEQSRTGQAYYPQPQLRRRPALPGFSSKEYQHRLLRRVYKVKNCPKGLIQDGDQCKDLNECTKPGRCQHKCENTHGSFHCLCPPGYALDDDQHTCRDINDCSEGETKCGETELCFNKKGTFKCIDITCPSGYTQGEKNNRFCQMTCSTDEGLKCPPGVEKSHVILQKWISLPSGVLAYEDLLELEGEDEEGVFVPHSQFIIESDEIGNAFSVRQENGKGIVSSAKSLEPGREYKFTVDAQAFDGQDNTSVIYTTEFQILLHISRYPY